MDIGTSKIRPRARLLRTIGDDLISSSTVAAVELVKNAYDADATFVAISIQPASEDQPGWIEVADDGCGMSLETVTGDWLEPATVRKKREPYSHGGRRVLGEKGIGRFAASRLGNQLHMSTRVTGGREVAVQIDWSSFDDESLYLDEVKVEWTQQEAADLTPDGRLGDLLSLIGRAPSEAMRGTVLRMNQLREEWSEKSIDTLRTSLARLVSPFNEPRGQRVENFEIWLIVPDAEATWACERVESPDLLRHPHYRLFGYIEADGTFDLEVELRNSEQSAPLRIEHTGKFGIPTSDGRMPVLAAEINPKAAARPPECGTVWLEYRVWDRDRESLRGVADEFSQKVADVRKALNEAAGVSVYRDSFRVLPYGEPNNDWLRLDRRRVDNPTMRISNKQIVGLVSLALDRNPDLRDQSNREGLIQNQALEDLKALLVGAMSILERERYVGKSRDRATGTSRRLFDTAAVTSLKDYVKRTHSADPQLKSLVNQVDTEIRGSVKRVQTVIARYRSLATLGKMVDIVLHDGSRPVGSIGTQAKLIARMTPRVAPPRLGQQIADRVGKIEQAHEVLSQLFKRIAPFGGRKRGPRSLVSIEALVKDAVSMLEADIGRLDITVAVSSSPAAVRANPVDLLTVFYNLLDNAVYWLGKMDSADRRIVVSIVDRASSVDISFADSGPGIDDEDAPAVFDPYFSTKPNGVGLGLSIIGELLADYYSGSIELIDGGSLSGATFRVSIPKVG